MPYSIEDLARTLKLGREAKGLSQRELSAKTGLTQSHISRIENAAVDIQLSNLLELARALDLEVMLVPRKAVPAAQGLVRNIETKNQTPIDASKIASRLQAALKQMPTVSFNSKELERISKIAAKFQNARVTAEQFQKAQSAINEFQRISDLLSRAHASPLKLPPIELKRLEDVTKHLREVQNTTTPATGRDNPNLNLPAYRLDKDNANG